MKFIWLAILVLGITLTGVLLASNKININQLLGPGPSQNGFQLTVTPGGFIQWAPLVPTSLPTFADYIQIPGTPDGTKTAFTLANSPNPASSLGVFKNGQLLQSGAGNDYTLSGAVVTFLAAPLVTDNLQASYRF